MSEIVATPSAQRPTVLHSAQFALAPPRRAPAGPRQASLRLRTSSRRTESIPSTDVRRRVLDVAGQPGPEAGIGAQPSPAAGADAVGFKNVVCITLYNEPFELLRTSLSALLLSISGQRLAPAQAATRSCVVIVADGRNRIDEQIMRFFAEVGVIDTGRSFSALGETVHLSRKRIDEVMAGLGVEEDLQGEIDFAICVKDENRGKLHSHALFFQQICPALGPEFCYQLDAGTVVEAGAVSKLVGYMDERRDVAAAASRILTSTPTGAASTLAIWQYMDFVMQKAVTWPTEVASGYLSVIPGQFCVFRWSAVSAPSSDDDETRPLDAYLRGLNAGRSARAGHVPRRGPRVRQRNCAGAGQVLAHRLLPGGGSHNRRLRHVRGTASSAPAVAEQRACGPPLALGTSARLSGSLGQDPVR
jgi:chitin synthase-like protein